LMLYVASGAGELALADGPTPFSAGTLAFVAPKFPPGADSNVSQNHPRGWGPQPGAGRTLYSSRATQEAETNQATERRRSMSAVLERRVRRSPSRVARDCSYDWETPSGPVEADAEPRAMAPGFTYRGYGEAHWRGQTCHLVGATQPDEWTVVLACGCRASVPWWTLEPIR
jgi:hypothetical protein